MPCKFIHIKETGIEQIIDLENIKLVQRRGDTTLIFFAGDEVALTLDGDAATAFWEFIINYAPTIFSVTPGHEKAEALHL